MALVYSCCFWFSLRLGGILIGLTAIIKAITALVVFCIAYKQPENVKYQISLWMTNMNLIHVSGYLENFQAGNYCYQIHFISDPEKFLSYGITLCCIYLVVSVLYIYGAYMCNNISMIPFILVEFIHLIILSIFITTWLIVLKQNTMDIGLVIGASVTSGFILMGLCYLWVCAATLPVLINEIEQEEQRATINKLQKLLEDKNQRLKQGYNSFNYDNEDVDRTHLFVVPRYINAVENTEHYYRSNFLN
ncbi:uncharacterized protein LOC124533389 [Vanessa cardui]|uniref:uncharacterized protein LOC124533389 n=1 Tax=Vanessa cardui TaxID=171605 RepID=UPI001F132BF3|nr:uncharacterized protein LOC124533389 [Vanessa cardui]